MACEVVDAHPPADQILPCPVMDRRHPHLVGRPIHGQVGDVVGGDVVIGVGHPGVTDHIKDAQSRPGVIMVPGADPDVAFPVHGDG